MTPEQFVIWLEGIKAGLGGGIGAAPSHALWREITGRLDETVRHVVAEEIEAAPAPGEVEAPKQETRGSFLDEYRKLRDEHEKKRDGESKDDCWPQRYEWPKGGVIVGPRPILYGDPKEWPDAKLVVTDAEDKAAYYVG